MWPPVFQTLKGSDDIKAFVGTNPPRIYPHGRAPQRPDGVPLADPFITWFQVTVAPNQSLSELPPSDRIPIQVDCYHPTDAGVRALALAARDAIEPFAVMTGAPLDERDTVTNLYHVALTFDWIVDR